MIHSFSRDFARYEACRERKLETLHVISIWGVFPRLNLPHENSDNYTYSSSSTFTPPYISKRNLVSVAEPI